MIEPTLLDAVLASVEPGARISAGEADDVLVNELRAAYPTAHFSVCSDDDVPGRMPCAAENAVCRIYYLTSAGHCISFAADAENASGLLVARIDREE